MSSGVPSVFTSKVGGGFPIRGTSRCLCVVVVGCLRGWPGTSQEPMLAFTGHRCAITRSALSALTLTSNLYSTRFDVGGDGGT